MYGSDQKDHRLFNARVVIALPESYQHRKLEVIVLLIEEEKEPGKSMITQNFMEHLIGRAMPLQKKES